MITRGPRTLLSHSFKDFLPPPILTWPNNTVAQGLSPLFLVGFK